MCHTHIQPNEHSPLPFMSNLLSHEHDKVDSIDIWDGHIHCHVISWAPRTISCVYTMYVVSSCS